MYLTYRTRQDMRADMGSKLTWHIAANTINKKAFSLHVHICSTYVALHVPAIELMKCEAQGETFRISDTLSEMGFVPLHYIWNWGIMVFCFFFLEVNGSLLPYVTSMLLVFWPWGKKSRLGGECGGVPGDSHASVWVTRLGHRCSVWLFPHYQT